MSSRNASADESGRGRAIVIGTGFAGAVAAMRLGEHGVDTIMLERGQAWPLRADGNTFPTVLAPDRRSAWFSALTTMTDAPRVPIGLPYAGLIERIEADGIDVAVGAGVGGGSLVYGGALVQPKQALFERVFPSAISYQEFDSIYYPRACARLRPAVVPADLLSREPYLAARQFAAHARDAGFVPQLLETGFDMSLVREELEGSKPAAAIIGEYLYGTNSGAKVGLDRTYLDAALATGNVQILPLHEVTEIARKHRTATKSAAITSPQTARSANTRFCTPNTCSSARVRSTRPSSWCAPRRAAP